uniref:Uncharacterized protein n=1 Tax=Sarcoptes scabiei TaxID=52283 RepID=A0A834RL16_SARSC
MKFFTSFIFNLILMVSCHQTIDLNSSHNQMKNISSRSINPYDESDSLLELARNHLSKRSVPEFEATLNAMKCALRIVGLQVSEHHNNMIMCCGLWKMKSFMKTTADRVCENPRESNRVFDNFMTDELIYGKFTHSILGDDTLDCKNYPEGSRTCERLFAFITFILVMICLSLAFLIIGCVTASFFWRRYKRLYYKLLESKMSELDPSEKNLFMNDHFAIQKRKIPHWIANLNTNRKTDNRKSTLSNALKLEQKFNQRNRYNNNNRLDRNKTNKSTNNKRDSNSIGGKITPDSLQLPSSNSDATSQNTSIISLSECQTNNSEEKP